MAGRFWKWRMQGGALELATQAERLAAESGPPDVVIATDMVNLPAWLALTRHILTPATGVVCYMHENQLTYPWRPGEKPDLSYAMINWLSQCAADRVLFNTGFHLESWFEELPRLLKHFPDYNHLGRIDEVRERSVAAPVGIVCADLAPDAVFEQQDRDTSEWPPLIVWNQRWEYDKRPDRFFNLLYRLAEAGVPFQLAVAGENFRNQPAEFAAARLRLADRIVHWGYAASRQAYLDLLHQADLVISTADHEFFGISILEAVCAGAFPLLPNRLSYPELIPAELHPACLYTDEDDLFDKACWRLTHPRPAPPSLQRHVAQTFDWRVVAPQYDDLLSEVLHGPKGALFGVEGASEI